MSQFSKQRYKLIGLGGTFDHFHKGHEFFLTYASENAFTLLIGITIPQMIFSKSYPNSIQPYSARVKQVKDFCQSKGIPHLIIPLDNAYGPTLDSESKVKALCVTQETEAGAEKINAIRHAAGLRPLPVFIANMVLDENGQEIHADRIRAGVINRQGNVYQNILNTTLNLSEQQKDELKPALGKLLLKPDPTELAKKLTSQPRGLPICVVGDHCLEFFVSNNLKYDLGIFDGKEQRQTVDSSRLATITPDATVTNPAGTIDQQASSTLQTIVNQLLQKSSATKHVFVEGEEDLLTAALILLLPLQSKIYYGQPKQGMVEVLINEQVKEKIRLLLS
jgi:pantetheine-phosphate adenylyltransferase